MPQRYVIQSKDTLGKIAKRVYGDAALYQKLALYNGIQNPALIVVGQTIETPSRRELDGAKVPAESPPRSVQVLKTPNGLEEVLATFGNIYDYITDDGNLDPRWETEFLTRTPLPFPILVSWDRSKDVSRLYCHTKLKDIFPAAFAEIQKAGLQSGIKTFGGCFNFRGKRTSTKLSTHCWGVGIDLNPETNNQGTAGDMNPDVVEIFRGLGFKWGGDWAGKSKDPMHFQFCTGY